MTQDDAHIYCTREQMRDELTNLLTFVLDLLKDYGLDDFYLELSTRNPDKFVGDDEVWDEATRTLAEVAAASGLELVPGPGRRGVLRAEDLRPGAGRDRPHLADVDDPARLQPARAVRARVPGGRRHAAAARHDPPGALRLDRAVLRRPHRALRRRVPALAGAGAGGRRSRSATDNVAYLEDVAAKLRAQGVRVEVDASDDRMPKKIRNAHQGQGARSCSSRARRTPRTARSRSGSATARRTTASPSTTAVERIVEAIRARAQV